jgi:hypothetical protein
MAAVDDELLAEVVGGAETSASVGGDPASTRCRKCTTSWRSLWPGWTAWRRLGGGWPRRVERRGAEQEQRR